MSQGNSRTNGISDRKSNGSPNCEHHQDIGHDLNSPSCARGAYSRFQVQLRSSKLCASQDGVQVPTERCPPSTASRVGAVSVRSKPIFLLRTCSVSAQIS